MTFDANAGAGAVRRSWTHEEDELLKSLFLQHGPKWTAIAELMPSRNAKQCRTRWTSSLCLSPDIKKGPYTREEDEIIISQARRYLDIGIGINWDEIYKLLPHRTPTSIYLRWNRTAAS